ncbi:hypothetical protein NPIL_41731 [Nephila pilipes]|uniref:Uncharacterized protein n=1 Tax=Nephila pilipes TaxID=299642 RepID=A0A8X6NK23_NEPPI|nr:hypothetical protein NPIL_41731 [Nephila pilipes]
MHACNHEPPLGQDDSVGKKKERSEERRKSNLPSIEICSQDASCLLFLLVEKEKFYFCPKELANVLAEKIIKNSGKKMIKKRQEMAASVGAFRDVLLDLPETKFLLPIAMFLVQPKNKYSAMFSKCFFYMVDLGCILE